MTERKGYLIDMDGVVYRGNETIPGAVEFINKLVAEDIPFLFLTNNSQRTRRDIVAKLKPKGFNINESHVFTSALATAYFLNQQKPEGTAFVIGEGGLLNALHDVNYAVVDNNPDYVVVGEGRTITLESIEKAVSLVAKGAKLIGTNLDPSCPTQNGDIRPGCGAFMKMIEEATGIKGLCVGKPSPVIYRAARKELNLRTSETVMIGDTMETDILGGVQMGYRTILVLTGGTKVEELKDYPYGPSKVIHSIADLV